MNADAGNASAAPTTERQLSFEEYLREYSTAEPEEVDTEAEIASEAIDWANETISIFEEALKNVPKCTIEKA